MGWTKAGSKCRKIAILLTMAVLFQCIPMTALASLADGTTKLVGQWRFEEGTGSTVADTSENNNAGKFNGATWVEGKVGKALRFNQGQDYVEIPHHADLSPRSALTVEAWVNFDKAISWQKVIAKSLGSDTDYSIIQGTRNNVGFTFNIGTQVKTIYSATNSTPLGTWVYVVGTYDGTKTRLYINGKEDNSSYVKGLINDHKGPLRIGGDKSTINGKIDEVNIYNKALTAAEIMDRYKAYTETAPANVAVTGVSLNKTSVSLNVGATEGLVATVAPSNATNKAVSWTSSNTAVATVDANGNVRAIAAGSANITVTTADGGKKATCAVTVIKPTVAVTGVSLNKTSVSLNVGATEGLVATVAPSNATNKAVSWTSSNTAVATVDANGNVRAIAAGSANITVTTADGGKKATCAVTVIKPTDPVDPVNSQGLVGQWNFEEGAGNTVSDTSGNNSTGKFNGATWVEGKVGTALRFNQGQDYVEIPHHAALSPRSALTVEAWVNFDKAISWQKVIAKSLGSDTDYSIIQGTRNNVGFTFNIGTQVKTIYSATNSTPLGTWVYVVGTYDGTKTRLYINGKEDISSYVKGLINDHQGPLRIGGDKSTMNGKIDEVNIYNRALTATEIMDRYKAYTETAPANVAVTGVGLNKTSVILNAGATEGLIATVAPSNATNKAVSWTSSNTAVATADANGNVRAIAAGSATITVTTADGGKKATCTVNVGSSQPIETEIIKKMDTGFNFTLRVKENGTVWFNGNKQDGTTVTVSQQMAGIEGVKDVAAVDLHAVMLKNDGTVWSWGLNSTGQFGDGTKTSKTTPVQMQGIRNAVAVAAGVGHSLVLKSDGTVWGSGMNSSGQLGDGTTVEKTLPVQVQGLSGVKAIEIGRWHSLALKNDGTVWSWGVNNAGQLGDRTTVNKSRPVKVNNLERIVKIASGSCHSLAIKDDGTVWSWGFNKYGQVGDGTIINRTQPAQISGIANVVAVSTGRWHSLALKNDGTVWSWGYNAYGQLGDGTTTNRYKPVQVKGLTNIVTIVAGECQSFAIDKNGTIWAWGSNGSGELGDGTTTNRPSPVVVR